MRRLGKRIVKNLVLDSEVDHDIVQWLDDIPSRRMSEFIRLAIRHYMDAQEGETGRVVRPKKEEQTEDDEPNIDPSGFLS